MKKRILTIIITLAMAMGMISAATTTVFADNKAKSGTWGEYEIVDGVYKYTYADFSPFVEPDRGTMDNPYVIDSPAQLAGLAALVNAYNGGSDVTLTDAQGNKATATNFYKNSASQYIKLAKNIDLSQYIDSTGDTLSGLKWLPIGADSSNAINPSNAFKGNFDGNGYTISGMAIGTADEANQECQYAGLFGYMTAGSIKNLAVNGVVNVSCSNKAYAGGIVGCAESITIKNCSSTVSVTANSPYIAYAGGLVGQAANVTISNCYSAGSVSGTTAGGLVGNVSNLVTIEYCYWYMNSSSNSNGTGNYTTGSPVELAQEQMKAAEDTSNSSWESLPILKDTGSLVDALNKWVESNPSFTPWHIHKGGYPSLGNLSYNNGICVCGYACTHTFTETSNGFCTDCDGYQPAVLNDDVYEISNAGQLYWFAKQVNSGNTAINGKLMDNITVFSGLNQISDDGKYQQGLDPSDSFNTYAIGTGIGGTTAGAFYVKTGDGYVIVEASDAYNSQRVKELLEKIRPWTPIGNATYGFSGTFDGKGKTISGLYINDISATSIGLFGYVTGGTVKDLTLSNSFFNGYQDVGGVVGLLNNGTIKNCTSYATVCGANGIGGIAGYCSSGTIIDSVYNISDCYNRGIVSAKDHVGGIIGVCENSSVYGCANNGNVISTNTCGGIVGLCNNSLVSGCTNNGNVSGKGFVGGVVGYNKGSTVKDCYSDNCTVSGTISVGGIVGYIHLNATVSRCNNASDVSGTSQVGGVIGYIQDGSVSDCYNTGNISGTKWVGGVVGHAYDSTCNVSNCYNIGKVSGETKVGGIVGSDNATVSNCYYLADSETDSIDGTTFKTSAQFASGEVTYLLNGDQTTIVWYQTCGTGLPAFSGYTVYKATKGCTGAYVNDPNAEPKHTFTTDSNGFCAACGSAYQPAVLNGNVYEISSAGQLYWFAQQVNGGNTSINGKLTANIVVNEGTMTSESTTARLWTPIGNEANKYGGNFYGNGKTVSGLYFNNSGFDYVGLFGYANGLIENVGVINSFIKGGDYVGGVVGLNYSNVLKCYNASTVSGNNYVGGIVGSNNYTVRNCFNTGTVSGYYFVGGVIGDNNLHTVTNCYNTGDVSGTGSVGGVIGIKTRGTVTNCYYLNTAASSGINGEDATDQAEAKTADQFASGEVAYLLNGDQSGIVWYQTCGEGLPAYSGIRVYRNQLGGCSEVSYKYEYSNEQKAPVITHDTTKYTYAEASIVNSITATCGDCRTANWTVTLTAPENAVYNGSFIPATVIGEIPGVKVTVSYNKDPINAGAYTASVTLGDVEASVEYNIAQKVLVPTITGRVTKVYDGTNAVPAGLSIVLEGIVGADNVTASAIYTFDRPDAGTKKINAECILLSGEKLGNYTLSSSTASADVGEITKAQSHLITAPTAIGGLIYNKQAQPLVTPGAAEFGTIVYSFDCMNWSTSIATAVNAGSYTVFYKVAGDQNHLDTAPAVITVSVAQREVGIIWGQNAFEFNEQRQVPTATVIGVLPGDVCTVGVQGWGVYGGTYTATARSLSNPNYKLPASGTTCQFTITVDYDKEADKVLDGIGNAIGNAVQEHVVPAITNVFNEMLENLFKMLANLFD